MSNTSQNGGPVESGNATGHAEVPSSKHRVRAVAISVIVVAAAAAIVAVMVLRPKDARSAMYSGHYSIARYLLESAARGGDARSQNTLANLYYLGLGGPHDQISAASWYLEAALRGNTDAQINIARHYVLGLGVPKDVVRGFAWLYHARSAGREVAEGQMRLLTGSVQITPNNVQRARELYPTVESLRPRPGDE
jgi:TPR repeat protein